MSADSPLTDGGSASVDVVRPDLTSTKLTVVALATATVWLSGDTATVLASGTWMVAPAVRPGKAIGVSPSPSRRTARRPSTETAATRVVEVHDGSSADLAIAA